METILLNLTMKWGQNERVLITGAIRRSMANVLNLTMKWGQNERVLITEAIRRSMTNVRRFVHWSTQILGGTWHIGN